MKMVSRKFRWVEKGQGLVEYALILVLVAIVVIVALSALAPSIGEMLAHFQCTLKFGREAYAAWPSDLDKPMCFADVVQPDGTTQRIALGLLFEEE